MSTVAGERVAEVASRIRAHAVGAGSCIAVLCILSLVVLVPGQLRGQEADSTASLVGQVVSAMTGGPLENAQVILKKEGRSAVSDGQGRFAIRDVSGGDDTLQVRLLGFQDEQVPIKLKPGHLTRVTLLLSETVLKVEDISVEVQRPPEYGGKLQGFRERERLGQGVFITPEEVADRAERAQDASDLLRGEPGILVGASRVGRTRLRVPRLQRECEPFVFLDGIPARGYHIDNLAPEEVLAIELYRGPSETPPQFVFRGGACATMVIWTRNAPRRE